MKKYTISFIAIFILSLGFTFLFYGNILISPNSYLFSTSGDGIKNYYTYAYHIKHDSSLINFGGMNYPYGEHFMYTDCHPLLTLVMQSLRPVFPGISNYSVGFVNFLMIISFIITALALWLVFRELKVEPWIAVAGSFGIMMLAPQIFRMTGHLALSYSFFIPLTLFLTLRHYRNPTKKKWLWLQSANVLFWFFIHAYLGMIAVSFIAAFWLIHFIFHYKQDRGLGKSYLPFLLWVIFPVLFFLLFIEITDIHVDRTSNPSGFFLNNAEPDDLIVPHAAPLRPVWDSITKVYQNWEGWSYFGLTTMIILVFVVIKTVINLIRRKRFSFDEALLPYHHFNIAIWASLLLLLFAFGMPFKLYPPMADWVPYVKQFRATGRFAWVFYFTSTVMSVLIINNLMLRFGKGAIKYPVRILALLAILFYGYEGLTYHRITKESISRNQNLFTPSHYDPNLVQLAKSINVGDYQAVLPLPFFYIGSENFTVTGADLSVRNAFLFSYYTGLPVMSAYLTRTGIQESKNIIQVLSPDYYPKLIRPDLPSDKPFLVLKSPELISLDQEALQAKTSFVYGTDYNVLYRLDLNDLFRSTADEEILRFEEVQASLIPSRDFLVTDTGSFLYFDDFVNLSSTISFGEPGALTGPKSEPCRVAVFPPGTLEAGKSYTASMWMYNAYQDAMNFWFRFMAIEHTKDSDKPIESWSFPDHSECIEGDWSLVELDFSITDPEHELILILKGKDFDRVKFIADDLLVRAKDTDVYRIDGMEEGKVTKLFKNNQRIDPRRVSNPTRVVNP